MYINLFIKKNKYENKTAILISALYSIGHPPCYNKYVKICTSNIGMYYMYAYEKYGILHADFELTDCKLFT